MPEFDACYDAMRARHAEIDRVQVTNREMEELVLATGIARGEGAPHPDRRSTLDVFRPRDDASRLAARGALGLPTSAFVVGSFQKDGVGWGEGLEPKLIKGPDVLRRGRGAARRTACPSSSCCSPGRRAGTSGRGSSGVGIPYRHLLPPDVDAVAPAYHGARRLPRRLPRRGRAEARCSSRWRPASRS